MGVRGHAARPRTMAAPLIQISKRQSCVFKNKKLFLLMQRNFVAGALIHAGLSAKNKCGKGFLFRGGVYDPRLF